LAEGSISFFEKKKQKTVALLIDAACTIDTNSKRIKVSWFFFSKKNCFLGACLPLAMRRPQCELVLKFGFRRYGPELQFHNEDASANFAFVAIADHAISAACLAEGD